jgi:divalent metal cation (Fe/Co/Zn/Cd) transporter
MRIAWQSAREIGMRALDGVDPGLVDALRAEAGRVPGVLGVDDVRARWLGHVVRSELTVAIDGQRSAREATAIGDAVRDRVIHNVDHVADAVVEVRAGRRIKSD